MPLITIHRLVDDARRVTVENNGVVQDLGRVYSDGDLTETLRRVGIEQPEDALDDTSLLRWEGEDPHVWGTQQPRPPTRP